METDSDDWPARAAADSTLVAATLLRLSRSSGLWSPPTPQKWGRRARRSGAGTAPPPPPRKDARSPVAGGEKVRRPPSPLTPLEYRGGCGASESGSEEIAETVKGSGVSAIGGGPEMKLSLESQKRPCAASQMTEEEYPKRLRSCSTFIQLPDLNIPVIGESD